MSFDQMLIHFCSPTLCEIKPGNMFFVKNNDFSENNFEQWKKSLFIRGFLSFAIKLSENSTAILICNVCWVRKILGDIAVHSYLVEKGYHCGGVFDFVNDFTYRLHSIQGFPHEIGVILGYPVDDVIEFENHEGQNCKYCGQWKSYTDIEKAKQCHCNYKKCCCFCERLYNEGYTLEYILQEYKKNVSAA